MLKAYIPRSKKKRSHTQLTTAMEAYLTNGHYDQKKSAMIADKRKTDALKKQRVQPLILKDLRTSATIFNKIETLVEKIPMFSEEEEKQLEHV